jgi:hypothetical protein
MSSAPTAIDVTDARARPYFLWWTDATVGEFVERLTDPDPDRRAYWLGALLREAHTRDVWRFTTPDDVRALWPHLVRHLGRSRAMWAWLLRIDQEPAPEQSWARSTGG